MKKIILLFLMTTSFVATTAQNIDTLNLDKKICDSPLTGKYKHVEAFLNKKKIPVRDKTTYFEFKDGCQFDYYENGKYYMKWSVKWINNCEWEQQFMETTEPNLKEVMRKEDKISFKVLGSAPNGDLWITSNTLGVQMLARIRKVKEKNK